MTDWREECQSLSDENERLRARIAELEAEKKRIADGTDIVLAGAAKKIAELEAELSNEKILRAEALAQLRDAKRQSDVMLTAARCWGSPDGTCQVKRSELALGDPRVNVSSGDAGRG